MKVNEFRKECHDYLYSTLTRVSSDDILPIKLNLSTRLKRNFCLHSVEFIVNLPSMATQPLEQQVLHIFELIITTGFARNIFDDWYLIIQHNLFSFFSTF